MRSVSCLITLSLLLFGVSAGGAGGRFAGEEITMPPHVEAPVGDDQAGDVDDAIRTATGLRFRVVESLIRRNITSSKTRYGYKIRSVDADSPASRAGLKKGDVLLTWDGEPIKSRSDLREWIAGAEANAEIPITYARLKAKHTLGDRHPWQDLQATITLEQ